MQLKPIAAALMLAAGPVCAAADNDAVLAEMKRLSARIEALEKQNKELEKALASERLSEREPELATRLKAVEAQTLAMQKPVSKIDEALSGVAVSASITGVVQKVGRANTAAGIPETRASYRGDLNVTLPGGEMGYAEGKIFTHFRFGQGNGPGLRQTAGGNRISYTNNLNSTSFQTAAGANDSFAILAQAWYQLSVPLVGDGVKANAREFVDVTVGKIDSFGFFDKNDIADDESSKFLNNVFVHNPLLDSGGDIRADSYGFAPGAIVKYRNEEQKGSEWGLSLGVFGSGPGANFSGSLSSPYIIAQAETAARINYLPGNYRLYAWRNGRAQGYDKLGVGDTKHVGWGVSVDQKVDDDVTLFGRYGHSTKGKVRFDRALTVGAELSGSSWHRAADGIGLAFGTLRTSKSFRNDSLAIDANADGTADWGYQAGGSEKQTELYYRYKLNGRVELSPDLQWVKRPGGNAAEKTIRAVGLRMKVGF